MGVGVGVGVGGRGGGSPSNRLDSRDNDDSGSDDPGSDDPGSDDPGCSDDPGSDDSGSGEHGHRIEMVHTNTHNLSLAPCTTKQPFPYLGAGLNIGSQSVSWVAPSRFVDVVLTGVASVPSTATVWLWTRATRVAGESGAGNPTASPLVCTETANPPSLLAGRRKGFPSPWTDEHAACVHACGMRKARTEVTCGGSFEV